MKLFVLFGQRKGSHPGQYGLEAVAVMTEADREENEHYLPETLEENRSTGDFESLGIVTLEVSEAAVRKILVPEAEPVPAKVLEP